MPAPETTAYLLLELAGMRAALRRDDIREILPLPHLHMPPAAGGALIGFLNLSGRPVPVLDLARLLGLREETEFDPYRHVVLSADGDKALLVDRVADLITVDPGKVQPVEDAHTFNGCVDAEIVHGDQLIPALSLARLLTAEEQQRVEAFVRRAAERLTAFETADET